MGICHISNRKKIENKRKKSVKIRMKRCVWFVSAMAIRFCHGHFANSTIYDLQIKTVHDDITSLFPIYGFQNSSRLEECEFTNFELPNGLKMAIYPQYYANTANNMLEIPKTAVTARNFSRVSSRMKFLEDFHRSYLEPELSRIEVIYSCYDRNTYHISWEEKDKEEFDADEYEEKEIDEKMFFSRMKKHYNLVYLEEFCFNGYCEYNEKKDEMYDEKHELEDIKDTIDQLQEKIESVHQKLEEKKQASPSRIALFLGIIFGIVMIVLTMIWCCLVWSPAHCFKYSLLKNRQFFQWLFLQINVSVFDDVDLNRSKCNYSYVEETEL